MKWAHEVILAIQALAIGQYFLSFEAMERLLKLPFYAF
jgi:hypothetical protein